MSARTEIPREWFVLYEPLPAKPRPIAHGFESIDWSACPLAQTYGVPGQTTQICSRTHGRRPW